MKTLLVAGLLLLAPASSALAQTIPAEVVGQRVRVELARQDRALEGWVPRQALRGVAQEVTADSLTVLVHPTAEPLRIALNGIHRVDVSRGVSRTRTAFRHALGFGLATYVAGGIRDDDHSTRLLAAGLGAGVGLLVGAIFPQESWRKVFDR